MTETFKGTAWWAVNPVTVGGSRGVAAFWWVLFLAGGASRGQ